MIDKQSGRVVPDLYLFGIKTRYGGLLGGGKNKSIIVSYITLRRLIGWLGILLPFICMAGGRVFSGLACQRSISFYYYTNMRDFFIGALLAVSAFLITYKGEQTIDNIVTWLIGLAGIAVALFPTAGPCCSPVFAGLFQVPAWLADKVHIAAAAVFFSLLALNSIFLFTLSEHETPPPGSNKKARNFIYVSCGLIIIICLVLFIVLDRTMGSENFKEGRAVLILETVMLAAFGISWLIKGETILGDVKKQVKQVKVLK